MEKDLLEITDIDKTWIHVRLAYNKEVLYINGKKKLEEYKIGIVYLLYFLSENIKEPFEVTEDYVDDYAIENNEDLKYNIDFFPEEIAKKQIGEFDDFEYYMVINDLRKKEE